jgi:AcrR family transcriptional regulator
MARPTDPDIPARLRDRAVDYVLTHGIGDLSLRPLAKALQTNARMLVYHFGSREGLMRQILAGLREREDTGIQAWFLAGAKPRTLPQFLRWYWDRLSVPQAKPSLRLLFELYALALRNPQDYPGILEDPLAYWRKLTEQAGLAASLGPADATLLIAALRGLLLDLCATDDHARVTQAMELLAQFIEWRVASQTSK